MYRCGKEQFLRLCKFHIIMTGFLQFFNPNLEFFYLHIQRFVALQKYFFHIQAMLCDSCPTAALARKAVKFPNRYKQLGN